jgi:uncharacterized protein YlxW (UPF0749 family)
MTDDPRSRDDVPDAPEAGSRDPADDAVAPHPFGSAALRRDAEPGVQTGDEPAEELATGSEVAGEAEADETDADDTDWDDTDPDETEADAWSGDEPEVPVEETPGDEAPPAAPAARPRRRRRDPLAAALIGVLTLLLGFAFAVQVRNANDVELLAGAREEDLVRILDELNAREERLREQIADQRSALQQLSNSDSQSSTALEEARRRAEAIGILNGTVAARGPGLSMTIRDPEEDVRVADVLDAIQELRGAGAETMQIDDVRIGVSSAVTGQPGNLMVDGRPITAPYEFLVIGSPQNMETAMNIPGGVVMRITGRGGSVTITQSEDVVVDALRPLDTPQYASPDTGD